MSAFADMKRRLRDRSEHYLLQAAIRDLGSGTPATVKPYRERGGVLWRWLFVPLYRRLPWAVKRRAMFALRMIGLHGHYSHVVRAAGQPGVFGQFASCVDPRSRDSGRGVA